MSEAGASHGPAGAETIRHEFVDVNGVRIHYAIAPPGELRKYGVQEPEGASARAGRARRSSCFCMGFLSFGMRGGSSLRNLGGILLRWRRTCAGTTFH